MVAPPMQICAIIPPMALREPSPPVPDCLRYSEIPLPPYRYVPGLNPHPRTHPQGHSYGQPDEPHPAWTPTEWRTLGRYLYGIDLYNYAYWWECHEALEGLWRAAGKTTTPARFLQGIIQIAAANLHRHMGRTDSALGQAEKGLGNLTAAIRDNTVYMGIDIRRFCHDVEGYFHGSSSQPALIRLFVAARQPFTPFP